MLLQTKLIAPSYSDQTVTRARLLEQVNQHKDHRLIYLQAPAGYGKTTFALQWINFQGYDSCWLSLDKNDDDPKRFWRYVIGAFSSAIKEFGIAASTALDEDIPTHDIVAMILNELNDFTPINDNLVLVLDDIHVIHHSDIIDSLSYLIDYLPPHIKIVMTTRHVTDLPIARWKVKNWVTSIAANRLRLSLEETSHLANSKLNADLSDKQCQQLHAKTEGWVAAIQLAALSPLGLTQISNSRFTNTDVLVNDKDFGHYILSDVLSDQNDERKEFLFQTACLNKVSAELCDDVLDRNDSAAMLEGLDHDGIFIMPLDKSRTWYRFQDIFRKALYQLRSKTHEEALIATQHRAMDWLSEHQHPKNAIEQCIELDDEDSLAQLLKINGNALIHEGHHGLMLEWLELLELNTVLRSPRLLMLNIWALFFGNKIAAIPPLIDTLETLISNRDIKNIELKKDRLTDIQSEISLIRSYVARSHSESEEAKALTDQVLEQLEQTDMPLKSVTYYGIGLDSYTTGDLVSAEKSLTASIEHGKREKKYSTILSSSGLLGWIFFYQGKLVDALETGLANQKLIDSTQDPSLPRLISCWQNSILATVHVQRAEFEEAESYINPLLEHITIGTEPGLHILIQYTHASYLFARKQYVDAIEKLDDAISVFENKKDVVVFEPPSLGALKARCLLAMNKVDRAKNVIDAHENIVSSGFSLNTEDLNLTRARILISDKEYEYAIEMCQLIIKQTREKGHYFHLIQALINAGLAHLHMDQTLEAQTHINEALSLSAKQGFISVFTSEAKDIASLLAVSDDPTIPDTYLQVLSNALGLVHDNESQQQELPGAAALEKNVQLLEPLSQRELEVIRLISQGLANKEIAQKLGLAPATVKAHIRNLYGKISAKSRTEALSKARQLSII